MKKVIAILMALIGITILIVTSCSTKQPKTIVKHQTTLLLGVENRQNLVRGWNDITMLITETENKITVTSIPRDTLIYIKPKGYWTLNAAYLSLGIGGVVNWFNHEFENLNIDNYVVYNLDKMDDVYTKLGKLPLPQRYKQLLNQYKYSYDWVRHRSKLKYYDYSRQMRVHAYMDKVVSTIKTTDIPRPVVWEIPHILKPVTEKMKFRKRNYGMIQMYEGFKYKPVEYKIWNGKLAEVHFDLKKPNGYTFQKGPKMVFILDHWDYDKVTPYNNPYLFSTKEFFKKKEDVVEQVKTIKGVHKTCTRWNGGLVVRKSKLISDYRYTNQNWTEAQALKFYKQFPECKLTLEEKKHFIKYCRQYNINFLAAAVQKEKESSLVVNRTKYSYSDRHKKAMGYACWVRDKNTGKLTYGGYKRQVRYGLRTMRRRFNEFKPGELIKITSYEGSLTPKNAATRALYAYTPFYGEAVAFGHDTVGNRRFMSVWYYFNRVWTEKVLEIKS